MPRFRIKVTEQGIFFRDCVVEVEAESEEDAMDKIDEDDLEDAAWTDWEHDDTVDRDFKRI